jgi:hypothetical protein
MRESKISSTVVIIQSLIRGYFASKELTKLKKFKVENEQRKHDQIRKWLSMQQERQRKKNEAKIARQQQTLQLQMLMEEQKKEEEQLQKKV